MGWRLRMTIKDDDNLTNFWQMQQRLIAENKI